MLATMGGGGIPFSSDLIQQLFFKSPYFSSTEVIDSKGNENFDLVESNCLYKEEISTYFEAVDDILLDQDFEVSFSVKPDLVANSGAFDKYSTNGISFKTRRTAGTVNTQILIKGTLKAATFTTLEALSTTEFTLVKIKRVGSNLFIYYNDILKSTIDLLPYGSIEETRKMRIYPGLMCSYNYNIYQGTTHIAHLPCSEGTHSTTTGLFNSVGTNWVCSFTGYSSNYAGKTQNNYHYNLQIGYTMYYNYNYGVSYLAPFKNGVPQILTGLQYQGDLLVKIADYQPGFTPRLETKIKFKTNILNLADRLFYLDNSGVPKGVRFIDLYSLEGKIFVDKSKNNNPRILTYSTEKTAADLTKVKTYIKDSPVELWIIAGQSNAGSGASLSQFTKYNDIENIYTKTWNVVDNAFYVSNTVIGRHENPKQNTSAGILFPFSRLRANANRHCYFVHYWVNGTPIFNDGTTANWNVNAFGGQYSNLLSYIDSSIAWLQAREISYVFKGIIWFQGEGDASITERQLAYKQNTIDLINGLRNHIGATTTIYIGKISTANGSYSGNIRTYQSELASELDNVYLIDTDGMNYNVDGIHLSAQGKISFAEAINNLL